MRIYCDSNIFRKATITSKQFNTAVHKTLEDLKDSFLFLYSDAHLHDLSSSPEEFRRKDLDIMESYVKNNYLSRDHITKKFHFYLATPAEAYAGIDFEAMNDVLADPFCYTSSMFDFEGGEDFKRIFDILFNLPIFNYPNSDLDEIPQEYHELLMGFNDIRSINDVLRSLKGVGSLLESKKEFNKYRNILSSYLDRKEYCYEEWELEFDSKMKETAFGKSFTEMVSLTIADADKDDDYTIFINTYINLEYFGVTEERSGKNKKIKKNSYWDIHRDAVHTYFASKSDYFVTADLGVQTKAFITYKLLDVKTQVLSVDDFIAKSPFLVKNEENFDSFFEGISFSLKNGLVIFQDIFSHRRIIKLPYRFLNYFDRMQINNSSEDNSIQLFRSFDKKYGTMFAEIEMLIKKCNKIFGLDCAFIKEANRNDLNQYDDLEFSRTWRTGKLTASLAWEKNSLGDRLIVLTITS